MSFELAAVISDDEKDVLFWHMPEERQQAFLPDPKTSQAMVDPRRLSDPSDMSLWDALVKHREHMAGTVHIHPWTGSAHPSSEDITSYEAFEFWRNYVRRYRWWVATFSHLVVVRWQGPGKHDYKVTEVEKDRQPWWVEELRQRSRISKVPKEAANAAEVQ
jgi:proteasome lid subunit RPN8/RPN11